MIEMRVLESEIDDFPVIQYRFVISTDDASVPFMNTSMNLIIPNSFVWSEWKTAPYLTTEDIYSQVSKKGEL